MVAPAFDYVAAGSYDEAVRLLTDNGDEAKILAGGQSLMPMLNLRLAHPDLLIDINGADQRPPTVENGLFRLPALTRHRVLLEHDLVRQHCPLLAGAVRHVGNVRVRNRGTIGGSLAHADPTSEIGCCALATGAQIVVRGPDGDGTVPARDLFAGYWTPTLDTEEIITDVLIPVARPRQGWSFHELVRRTSDFAIVAVGAIVNLAERNGAIAAAAACACGPYRVPNASITSTAVFSAAVFTNHVPASAFRGFGAMQVVLGYESQLDELAVRLGLSRTEVRERNFLAKGDLLPTGERLDTCVEVAQTMHRALALLGEPPPPSGPGRRTGRGIGCNRHPYGRTIWFRDRASAWLSLQADGTLLIRSGVTDLGAGQAASLCQIAAEVLGVPLDDIASAIAGAIGVRPGRLPMTPERILALLDRAGLDGRPP